MTDATLAKQAAKVAAGTLAFLLVPLVAMQFTHEVSWAPGDFVAAAVLLFGAGMAYVLAARRVGSVKHRAAVGVAIALLLTTVWAELAVGLFN